MVRALLSLGDMRHVATMLVVLLLPLAAVAQPSAAPPAREVKSEDTALVLALGGTALATATTWVAFKRDSDGLVLAALGAIVVGPSLGHIYTGDALWATVPALARIASFGMFALAGAVIEGEGEDNGGVVALFGLAGISTLACATLYNLADARDSAKRANGRAVTISPTVLPTSHGPAAGLSLVGSF